MVGELAVYSVRVFRIFTASFLLAGFNVVIGGYFTAVEKAGFEYIYDFWRIPAGFASQYTKKGGGTTQRESHSHFGGEDATDLPLGNTSQT